MFTSPAYPASISSRPDCDSRMTSLDPTPESAPGSAGRFGVGRRLCRQALDDRSCPKEILDRRAQAVVGPALACSNDANGRSKRRCSLCYSGRVAQAASQCRHGARFPRESRAVRRWKDNPCPARHGLQRFGRKAQLRATGQSRLGQDGTAARLRSFRHPNVHKRREGSRRPGMWRHPRPWKTTARPR